MSIISAHSLSMDFAGNVLFDNASFDIYEKDKVGLIGRNGTGKTTLMRLITGELSPSGGNLFISSVAKLGFVEQHSCSDPTKTAKEEMLSVFDHLFEAERELEALHELIDIQPDNISELIEKQSTLTEKYQNAGGLTFRSRAAAMLSGLGFTPMEQELSVAELSGGQRTKIALGKLLLSDADFIVLDEPTNHLDIKSVEWLEDFISKYNGAALIISHDRYFLDKVTNKTMEIEHKRITLKKGNYSTYLKLKAEQLEAEKRVYEGQQKEVERIEGIIAQQKRFNQARNYITIASKQKQIDRIKSEMTEIENEERTIKLKFECAMNSGNDVLMATELSKSYGDKVLFKNVSFNIYKGDRIFILGSNGCGKSTLLKALLGKLSLDFGYCRLGANVQIGYFDQIQATLSSEKTVLDEVYDKFPNFTISKIRGFLGAFNFSSEDITKKMKELSGGERARAALLELMLKKPNLLILDEPTNHLDISSREVLENALSEYEGTIICVSHDRFLVNKLSTKILVLDNGDITSFDGNYDDYSASLETKATQKIAVEKKPNEYLLRKERESNERKRRTKIAKLEAQIEEIEIKKTELEEQISSPEAAADYELLISLTEELNNILASQESLYEEWMSLNAE